MKLDMFLCFIILLAVLALTMGKPQPFSKTAANQKFLKFSGFHNQSIYMNYDRSKNGTNYNLEVRIFPRYKQISCNCFQFGNVPKNPRVEPPWDTDVGKKHLQARSTKPRADSSWSE